MPSSPNATEPANDDAFGLNSWLPSGLRDGLREARLTAVVIMLLDLARGLLLPVLDPQSFDRSDVAEELLCMDPVLVSGDDIPWSESTFLKDVER